MNSFLAHFGPRGIALFYLSVGLGLALIIVTVALWDTGRLRVLRRIAGLVLSQALFLLAAFVIANRQIVFYATWHDLFGRFS